MSKNTFKVVYKGRVLGETSINLQLPDKELVEDQKGTSSVVVSEDGSVLMQVKHKFMSVGESIAQIKYSTSAKATDYGTVKVVQLKQQISSRGEDIYYFSNDTAVFEGTLEEAKAAFPDVDFSDVKSRDIVDRSNPEFKNLGRVSKPVEWVNQNYYDADEHGGKPTNWDDWADKTQLALDAVGLIPGVGEFADLANGVISLARGNYVEAGLNFLSMIPLAGTAATVLKNARKAKKVAKQSKETTTGVYDLIIKRKDDIKNYIGKSKDFFTRLKQHFNLKKGTFKDDLLDSKSLFHKMKGASDYEMEMVENWLILKKYGTDWQNLVKSGDLKKLLNKRNPVGGRFDLKSRKGIKEFMEKAEKIIDRFEKDGLRESIEQSLKVMD